MATRLKDVRAVMAGMGWTGSILARQLTKAGRPDRGRARARTRSRAGQRFRAADNPRRAALRTPLRIHRRQFDRDRHLPAFPERECAADAALGRILAGRGRRWRRSALDRSSLALP